MNKTLAIELSDQRRDIAHLLYAAIYDREGALRYDHEMHCEFRANVENKCDCNLNEAYQIVKGCG